MPQPKLRLEGQTKDKKTANQKQENNLVPLLNNSLLNDKSDPNDDNTFGVGIGHYTGGGTSTDFTFKSNNIINPSSEFEVAHVCSDDGDISENYFGLMDSSQISDRIFDRTFDFDFRGYGDANFVPFLTGPDPEAPAVVENVYIDNESLGGPIPAVVGNGDAEIRVKFSRPIDVNVEPSVTFGVREPYHQNIVYASSGWSSDSLNWGGSFNFNVETGDGMNTIVIDDAIDATGFPMCRDNRFCFNVQAASSLALDFIATAGVGKVELEWPAANSPDALGYTMYRTMNLTESTFTDTAMINTELITDTTYTDFDVIPDSTYCYMYKVVGTDLVESDFSKLVAATPVSAASGDANGDLSVDVLDIVAIVNYILDENPQPFLIEAADVNGDSAINVLDIVGVVNIILGVGQTAIMSVDIAALWQGSEEEYKPAGEIWQDGRKVYLGSWEELGGLQMVFRGEDMEECRVVAGKGLRGMELCQGVTGDSLVVVMYSLGGGGIGVGERELLRIEGGEGMRCEGVLGSDRMGRMVGVQVKEMGKDKGVPEVFEVHSVYPNPFNSVVYVEYGLPGLREVEVEIYNVLGQRIWEVGMGKQVGGYHRILWDGRDSKGREVGSGVYVVCVRGGREMRVQKVVLLK